MSNKQPRETAAVEMGGNAAAHVLSALRTCSGTPAFLPILSRIVTTGLWRDRFVIARAIAFCATSPAAAPCGLNLAVVLFHHARDPSAFAYNAMIRAHSTGWTPAVSLGLFRRMLRRGLYPDKFSFPFLLRACGRSGSAGEPYHAHLLKHGLERDPHVRTSLVHMYSSLGRTGSARKVFEEMSRDDRCTVAWNAIISGCAKLPETHGEGLLLFGEMAREEAEMNEDTLAAAFLCCASAGSLLLGKSVHGFLMRRGADPRSIVLGSSLLRMYVKCGCLEDGRKAFERLSSRDLSAWTMMIGGLAEHGRGAEALLLFEHMVTVEGLRPDSVTFTGVLQACSHSGLVEQGLRIFDDMERMHGVQPRIEHYGAMVDLLGRAGRVEEARQLVESMPFPPNQVILGSLLHARLGGEDELPGNLEGLLQDAEGATCVEVSNAYAKSGMWKEVGRVRRTMVERGVRKERGHSCVDVNGRVRGFLVGDAGEQAAAAAAVWKSPLTG